MEQKRMYEEQQARRRMIRRKRRRIKRIRLFLCRAAVLCVLFFILAGSVKLAGGVIERTVKSISNQHSGSSASQSPDISANVATITFNGNVDQLVQMGYDRTVIESLIQMAPENESMADIVNHIDEYPEELLELLIKNAETVDFVLNYPTLYDQAQIREDIDLSDVYSPGAFPLFIQWDTRWGYCEYGDNIIALSGCGPTCLSMVYVGLTGDTSKNPGMVAKFSEEQGFLDQNNNTTWAFMTEGAAMLGLHSKEISLDQSVMIRELEQGHPIICSMRPGDFTTGGHFIVLCGYKDGGFIVNDPNSKIRSEKLWDYDTLSYQIKNLWSFSKY